LIFEIIESISSEILKMIQMSKRSNYLDTVEDIKVDNKTSGRMQLFFFCNSRLTIALQLERERERAVNLFVEEANKRNETERPIWFTEWR